LAQRSYERRQPEKTVLYRVLAEGLETFLCHVHADPSRSLPRFVERELRAFLDCGLLCRGFARVACAACQKEILVAFSCKGRGFCPSCGARRMAANAAHLVDSVIPEVPVRQWVLSLPFDIRFRLAYEPKLLGKVRKIFLRALMTWIKRRVKQEHCVEGKGGAVTFVQRFDSALRLAPHFHVCALDGVFVKTSEDQAFFYEVPAPSDAEVAQLNATIAKRVLRLFRKLGLDASHADLDLEHDALVPIAAAAVQGRQALGPSAGKAASRLGRDPNTEILSRRCTRYLGFSLHANVRLSSCARERLEKLLRYAARPAIATERLSLAPDGRVIYKFKRRWKDGSSAVALEPLAFIERLAALIPRPRHPLLTYHGVLAPASKLRSLIAPLQLVEADSPCQETRVANKSEPEKVRAASAERRPRQRRTKYYSWAELIQRVFLHYVLLCPECEGERRIISFIIDPIVIRKILVHLGLPTEPPPRAGPRAPPGMFSEYGI